MLESKIEGLRAQLSNDGVDASSIPREKWVVGSSAASKVKYAKEIEGLLELVERHTLQEGEASTESEEPDEMEVHDLVGKS